MTMKSLYGDVIRLHVEKPSSIINMINGTKTKSIVCKKDVNCTYSIGQHLPLCESVYQTKNAFIYYATPESFLNLSDMKVYTMMSSDIESARHTIRENLTNEYFIDAKNMPVVASRYNVAIEDIFTITINDDIDYSEYGYSSKDDLLKCIEINSLNPNAIDVIKYRLISFYSTCITNNESTIEKKES